MSRPTAPAPEVGQIAARALVVIGLLNILTVAVAVTSGRPQALALLWLGCAAASSLWAVLAMSKLRKLITPKGK